MPDAPPDLPEQPVWDWLAARGVPFDVPTATLIALHGTSVPGPSPDAVCRLPGTRVVRHQLHGLEFDTERLCGPPAPPASLTARVYDGADGHATFEAAAADLAHQLGPPEKPGPYPASNVRTGRWGVRPGNRQPHVLAAGAQPDGVHLCVSEPAPA